jgi:hypothetical protein
MNGHRRPQTLAEVAAWSGNWEDLSHHLADFLHEFSARPASAMLQDRPRQLAGVFAGGDVCDAYLAGTAATLAARIGQPRPDWTDEPDRYLRTPWFASPGSSMRACLLLESPARFRERNLFVTANALSVA